MSKTQQPEQTISFSLCTRFSKCCPEVSILGDDVQIEDDDGNRVHLSREQLKVLCQQSEELFE